MLAVIDIGSNSVRLLYDKKKYIRVTQLSQGLSQDNILKEAPMLRTLEAVISLYSFALSLGAEEVKVFATEAVRRAKNSQIFLENLLKNNIKVEVLSAKTEAQLGFLGAYQSGVNAILDIGGASSELVVGDSLGIIYNYSLPYGCVTLTEKMQNICDGKNWLTNITTSYGDIPKFDKLIGIGGTLSGLCAVHLCLEVYDPTKIHNYVFYKADIEKVVEKILVTPMENRLSIVGLHPKKTAVLPYGGLLLISIMEYLNAEKIVVSENDNLEGYLKYLEISHK